ncbi:TonB-linked outer membrane protein, SusC/RagA family [Chitinophaga costaii]|uniref:TonB-linked outer membrane protein, SusC/RagA family n=2 Tax=Chitinophaga costaii TaxID=1335309 RepID=A0A1C4E852_9BACT|nr:TonB-linked outer membrane protein, SusC/RagA family [Chitinophaga costaii]
MAKMTLILVSVFILQLSATTLAQQLTISKKNAPLPEIFKEIRQQSGFDFIYTSSLIQEAKPVTIHVSKASLEEVLTICFANQPLSYSLSNKTITVKRKTAGTNNAQHFTAADVKSDSGKVASGIVRDNNGIPLLNVSVWSMEVNQRTVTDVNGAFTVPIPDDGAATLAFSCVGMKNQQITYNGQRHLNVVLTATVSALNEFVVNGYQTIKKSDMVGAVSSVNAKDLYINGFTSIEQALQGKLTGVMIENTSGLVGTRQKTRVRGTSTLLGTQEPVWVVDGIIQQDPLPFKQEVLNSVGEITRDNFDYIRDYVGNSIAWLNPMDIENITVLKDASATAIYGIRAANGVIVITTKKGKSGPASINYSFGMNTTDPVDYKRLELMNSRQRIAVSREIYERGLTASYVNSNIGYAGALTQYLNKDITYDEFNAQVHEMEAVNTDWFSILFRTPISTNHNLSISGGSTNTRFYTSFGYNNTQGTAIGNGAKAYTGNMSVNMTLSPKLNVAVRLSGSEKNTDGFYLVDPYSYAKGMNRVLPATNADGSLFYYKDPNGFSYNFLNERNNTGSTNKVISANTSLEVNYDIIKGLKFQTLFSYNATSTVASSYATEKTEYIAHNFRFYDYGTVLPNSTAYLNAKLPRGGEYNSDNNTSAAWNWRNSLSYSTILKQKHALAFLFGQEANSTRYNGLSSTTYGYLRDRGNTFATVPLTYTARAVPNDLLSSTYQPHIITNRLTNTMGFYLTGSYTYDNRYVANFSVRTDASNRFGQFTNESFNPVYAGGLRWNMAREKWFEKTRWISDISLRASGGYQRNIVTSVSPTLILKIPSGAASNVIDQFTGEELLDIASLPYADLRWEKNSSVNLGTDLNLLDGRIQFTLDYYNKTGKDLISLLNVPVEYGVQSMPVNGGSMKNTGWELSTSFVPVRTKDFTFSVSLNSSKNYNKVIKTGTQNVNWKTAASGALVEAGHPVSGFWAFDYQGIDKTTGYPIINLDVKAGSDPTVDPTAYMKYVGKLDPDFVGGMGINLRYKKLTFNSSLYLQLGGKKFLAPAYPLTSTLPTEYENLSTELLKRWTPTNVNATLPGLPDSRAPYVSLPGSTVNSLNQAAVYDMYNYSTARVVSATSLRVNNISLNYSLPDKLVKGLGFHNINAGASASNLLNFVSKDFKGRDPEVATGAQPLTRAYTLNVNCSF